MCRIPSEFLYGEGVCNLLHLFSLYFHLSYLLCLLSCARSSLASRACCCFLPQQPKRTADSRCAPSLLLMSSWATRSFGASWHQNVAWPANHSPDFTQKADVRSLTKRRRKRWEPKGLSERTWLHVTSWGGFSVCGSWREFCYRSISKLCSVFSFRQLLHPCPWRH